MNSTLEKAFFFSVRAYLIVPTSLEMSGPEKDPYAKSTPVHEVKSELNTHMIIIKDWSAL